MHSPKLQSGCGFPSYARISTCNLHPGGLRYPLHECAPSPHTLPERPSLLLNIQQYLSEYHYKPASSIADNEDEMTKNTKHAA